MHTLALSGARAGLLLAASLFAVTFATAGRGHGHGHGHGGDDDDDDDGECYDLAGEFFAAVDGSSACTSAVGFCSIGELSGDIVGTYAFTMDTQVPVGDPADATFAFTGNSVITTDDGVIYGSDSGTVTFSGDFAFMTLVRSTGGEDCYEDISGDLLALGVLDLVTGVTSGTWTAEFCGDLECLEDDDDDDDGWGHGSCSH